MRTRFSLALACAFAALLAFGGTALADEPAPAEPAEPEATEDAPPAEAAEEAPKASTGSYAHLGGSWKSDWGDVEIVITGTKASGKWDDGTGPGEFSGEFDENGVLTYSWTQGDQAGKGTFREDSNKLIGRWGYKNSSMNGGDWSLWRDKK